MDKAVTRCAEKCGAKCCRYVLVKIPAPRRRCDFDELRWFLAHDGVSVLIESRLWYLQFSSRCKFLDAGNLCSIYGKRFDVCRQYELDTCEHSDGEQPIVFNTIDEFDVFMDKRRDRRRARPRKSLKGKSLR